MVDFAPVARRQASADTDIDRLGDEIAELTAHLDAATYRLLVRLREFDALEGWSGGFRSCAHWLSWRTGIAPGAAREKVRVARALAALPHASAALESGRLSYAKVRALTRVATPTNEVELVALALEATAAQLERIVRAWRRVHRLEELAVEQERYEARALTLYVDQDGSFVIRGRLDPEAGALLERALAAAAETLRTGDDDAITAAQRRADALALVAEQALGSSNVQRRHASDHRQVVIHVDAEALRCGAETGQSVLAPGIRVSAETSRRVACDAKRVFMTYDRSGNTLDVGRRTRTVPVPIRRALEHRDRGCRFPGCTNRFCDAHHIEHWADGGATRLGNLLLLCRAHYRAVHEGGFRVLRTTAGVVKFYRPDGEPLPDAPAALAVSGDPVAALISMAVPRWTGARLDLDYAVRALGLAVPRPPNSAR